jgi:hypothetical protein
MDAEIYPGEKAEKKDPAGHQNADGPQRKGENRSNNERRGTRTPATWGPIDPPPRGDQKDHARAANSWQQAAGQGTRRTESPLEEEHRDIRRGLERLWDLMHGRNHDRRVHTRDSDQPSNAAGEPRETGADQDAD